MKEEIIFPVSSRDRNFLNRKACHFKLVVPVNTIRSGP